MEETATMKLGRSHPVKQGAEEVLKELGMPMATAIDIYLRQIAINSDIPFPVTLNQAPEHISADRMSVTELREAVMTGYREMEIGEVQDARTAFARFREKHK